MPVQAVDTTLMALRAALELRRRSPLTPYKQAAWESSLRQFNLLRRFSKIPDGLSSGFNLKFPNILRTQSPPNKPSVNTYQPEFRDAINKEIIKGRYLGPFPLHLIEAALGPFQSSPISIIPKPGRPGKFRLIQSFSFPLSPSAAYPNPSINSQIEAEDFPTTWGNFSVIYLLIARLPPGSEAATRDVAEAYRTIPLHPSQWPAAVVRISDSQGCIDTCVAFGASPSAGGYGHMSDAGCEIMPHSGIGPLDNQQGMVTTGSRIWFQGPPHEDGFEEFGESCATPIVDLSESSPRSDHDRLFSYCFSDLDRISAPLGNYLKTSLSHHQLITWVSPGI